MAASTVLPTHQRYINGVPVPQSRKTLRLKEKYIILLVFVSFGFVCFGAFMFLPDLGAQVRSDSFGTRDIFVPKPENDDVVVFRHHPEEQFDAHQESDKIRLNEQIKNDAAIQKKLEISENEHQNIKDEIQEDKDLIFKNQQEAQIAHEQKEREANLKVELDHEGHDIAHNRVPSDDEAYQRQQKVKEVRTVYVEMHKNWSLQCHFLVSKNIGKGRK